MIKAFCDRCNDDCTHDQNTADIPTGAFMTSAKRVLLCSVCVKTLASICGRFMLNLAGTYTPTKNPIRKERKKC